MIEVIETIEVQYGVIDDEVRPRWQPPTSSGTPALNTLPAATAVPRICGYCADILSLTAFTTITIVENRGVRELLKISYIQQLWANLAAMYAARFYSLIGYTDDYVEAHAQWRG